MNENESKGDGSARKLSFIHYFCLTDWCFILSSRIVLQERVHKAIWLSLDSLFRFDIMICIITFIMIKCCEKQDISREVVWME